MKNQLRRLRRTLSTVAVMALVLTVTAPDVLAQNRGRANDQEARTSGRSATVDRSASRKSTAAKAPQSKPKAKVQTKTTRTTKTTTRARGNRKVTTDRKVDVTRAPRQIDPQGSKDRGSRATAPSKDRGSRATTPSKDRGSRATTPSKERGSRTATRTNDKNRGSEVNDRGSRARNTQNQRDATVDKRRNNRPVVNNRSPRKAVSPPRATRVSTRDGRRVKYRPPVVNPNRYYKYNRRYNRYVHTSSHLFLGLTWPWQNRYYRNWAPRYRYRQVVYVNVGWGNSRRSARVDVSTSYNQRIIEANEEFAEIEITIDNIDIHQDGRYLGNVDRIPNRVAKIRATVWADGTIEFDKNIFVVGDRSRGFEIIATQQYDDYLLNAYRSGDRIEVAKVDLRRSQAKMISRSRLFNRNDFNGNVPISLLPDDDRLWDYRNSALSVGDDSGYRNRDLSIQYRTENGLDVALTGETYLERIN